MTPDEAIRHEWFTSSTSSSSSLLSSSTSAMATSSSGCLENTQQQTSHSQGALSVQSGSLAQTTRLHRSTTMEDTTGQQYGSYRYAYLNRGRKCVSKITAIDAPESGNGGLLLKSKLNGSASSSHALSTSQSQPASGHASTSDIVSSTGLDPSLDDSGTFLPQILS